MRKFLVFALVASVAGASYGAGPPTGSKTDPKARAEAYKKKLEDEKQARLAKIQQTNAFKQQVFLQQRQFAFQQQMMEQQQFLKATEKATKELENEMDRTFMMQRFGNAIETGVSNALRDRDRRLGY